MIELAFLLSLLPAMSVGSRGGGGQSYVSSYPLTDNNYNRNIRPHEGGTTDYIDIGVFVNSVRSVSEIDMTMILDVFLQASWQDHRLRPTWKRLNSEIYGEDRQALAQSNLTITLGKSFSQAIWRPDFYLPSAINIYPADDYNDNVCVTLSSEGNIFYSNRMIITVSCMMKLIYFPFDSHTCEVCIGSYKYHDGLVKMFWSTPLSGMYDDQATANFLIRNESRQSVLHARNKSMPFINDFFTEHCFEIVIDRKYNIFLVTLYLPSVALVALSWVNFWIDPKAIPARAGLSITAILAQITLIVGMASRFPSVSDLKMADGYLTVNFIYTFATLIEFAVVSYKPEEERIGSIPPTPASPPVPRGTSLTIKRTNRPPHQVFLPNEDSVPLGNGTVTNLVNRQSEVGPSFRTARFDNGETLSYTGLHVRKRSKSKRKRHRDKPRTNVDNVSKLFFPATFILWNVVFFSANLYLSNRLAIISGSVWEAATQ